MIALALLLACGADPPPAPPQAAAVAPPAPVAAASFRPGARIISDISGSMRGFAAQGGTRLARLHEEVAGALTDRQPGPLSLCLVGKTLSCPTEQGFGRYAVSDLYNSKESRFDIALDLDHPEGPQVRRFTVVVTDGIYGGTGAGGDVGCASGATAACVSRHLGRLVDEGYGIWFVALRPPFSGRVYAERAMDAEDYKSLQRGLEVEQLVSDFRPSPSDAAYNYDGPRPLLVAIVSKDIPGGRELTAAIAARLERAGLGAGATPEPPQSVELAPLDPERARITGLRFQGVSRTDGFLLGQGGVSTDPVNRQRLGWAQVIQCGRADKALMDVSISPRPPNGLSMTADPRAPAEVLARLEPAAGGYTLGLVCAGLAEGSTTDYTLPVVVDRSVPIGGWWESWSAPDTWSRPAGLYGLDVMTRAAMGRAAARLGPDDQLYLRVVRK